MSDLELLYVLLVAFYVWECACWVRRGGVAFVRGWGGSSRVAPLVGNQRGGFAFAQPFPPLGSLAIATQLPVSLAPEGALAYVATAVNPGGRPAQTGRFVRWDEIKKVAPRGKSVFVNGELFVRAQSTTHARWLTRELRGLVKLGAEARGDAIAKLIRSTFDTAALKQRRAGFETRVRPTRWLANALLGFVFLLAPLVVWRFGIALTWLPLVVGLFALTGSAMFFFRRAHRALHPEAEEERFSQCLMVLLFSPAAMRAGDLLSRPLLENFHPLAVAQVLCDETDFRSCARQTLLDLRHPALPLATEGQPHLAALEKSARGLTLAAAEKLVRQSGADPAALTRAPQPQDATCRAFCPRCHAQFTSTDLRCGDCGGMPLEPLRSVPGSGSS